ncbi:MCP four helix bundle domain-containing protein, partial [Puerhibacterium sp. TATVAM-FAB25]|uniref:MCP four helix bundle domain-containing protein n=1 Tax=Puerhibacterium sp. TATVAM-FAB25 TaxID=3093699 RepID=UPI00397D9430
MSTTMSPSVRDGEARGLLRLLGRSVQTKILAPVFLLAVVAVGTGVYALLSLQATQTDVANVARAQTEVSQPLQFVHQNQLKARMIIAQLAATADDEVEAEWLAKQRENDAEVDAGIAQFDATAFASDPDWLAFKETFAEWRQVRDQQIVPIAQSDDQQAYQEILGTVSQPLIDSFVANLDGLNATIAAHQQGVADGAADRVARAVVILAVVLVAGLVVALVVAVLTARGVRRSATAVQRSLEAMAGGDFTVPADVRTHDELGATARSLGVAQASVRNTLAD